MMKYGLQSILAMVLISESLGLSCLDESGKPVDRWVDLKESDNMKYQVLTGSKFVASAFNTSQTVDGNIMSTVAQLYSVDKANVGWGMYNDEPAGTDYAPGVTYAHGKGLVMIDTTTGEGFWLVHSMPEWPNPRSLPPIPFPSDKYGQSLECLSINTATADKVATLLQIARPYIYDSNMPSALADQAPNMAAWVAGGWTGKDHDTATQDLKTVGGFPFTQLVKSHYWTKDFWDDLVAPHFKMELDSETWRDGAGQRMPSICGPSPPAPYALPYDVYMVESVTFSNGAVIKGTQDHSKWAAGHSSSGSLSCIGDINRMCSQESRGGGAVCQKDSSYWESFHGIITSYEDCWAYDVCAGSSVCWQCPNADE
jgi:deoxyribonuclease-2